MQPLDQHIGRFIQVQIHNKYRELVLQQEKEFEKLRIQKRGGAILSVRGKVAKNRRKAKKLR